MERWDLSYNTAEDPFSRIYVPNKVEDLNLKVFNMIEWINEPKALAKYISCECRCELDGKKCNLTQKWNNDKCKCECKRLWRHCTRGEDYTLNPSTCACKCD